MKFQRTIFGLAAMMMSACSAVSGDKTYAGPFPADYEQQVKAHLQSTLKDPYSIQGLMISRPHQLSLWTGFMRSGAVETWASCVSYNAKNSYGAYVGLTNYSYYFRNGQLFEQLEGC